MRGIGPVRLEQTQADVTALLGPGRESGHPTKFAGETYSSFNYETAGVTLEVGYVDGVVSAVDIKSPSAILFGHPLADGVQTFRRLLRHRRHWHVDSCHRRVFTALSPGGPGTGIEWKGGKVNLVMIDAGGVLDACADL